jgi:copper chaperone NosL
MTARLAAMLSLMLSTAVACRAGNDGPPRIEVDRTPCAHCGMLVSEPVFAAAYRAPQGDARVFDDIACLLEAVSGEKDRSGLRLWFHDAATAQWIDGGTAVFVESAGLKTPMGGGFVAYKDEATAAKTAADRQGRVIRSVGDLLQARAAGGGV